MELDSNIHGLFHNATISEFESFWFLFRGFMLGAAPEFIWG